MTKSNWITEMPMATLSKTDYRALYDRESVGACELRRLTGSRGRIGAHCVRELENDTTLGPIGMLGKPIIQKHIERAVAEQREPRESVLEEAVKVCEAYGASCLKNVAGPDTGADI